MFTVYIVRRCWSDNENPRLEGEGGEAGKDKGPRFLFSHAPSLLLLPCHVHEHDIRYKADISGVLN